MMQNKLLTIEIESEKDHFSGLEMRELNLHDTEIYLTCPFYFKTTVQLDLNH